jgi:ribonuclease Y
MVLLGNILDGAVPLALGAAACYALLWWRDRVSRKARDAEAAKARLEAEQALQQSRLAAQEEALKQRQELERVMAARQADQVEGERRLAERETLLNAQLGRLVELEKQFQTQSQALDQRTASLAEREREATELTRQRREQLRALSGLEESEVRESFLRDVRADTAREANHLAQQIIEQARAQAEVKARDIVSLAIQRYAGGQHAEHLTTHIAVGDEIKGRIIGREGRNIRAFEAATGVTVLIDDAPGTVILSAFDPVRREVAREAMQRLIADGRIHPSRIEEIVAQVSKETEETITRLGERAVHDAGLRPVHPEILKLLGRLHFRHSYSQNILAHSVEVAHLVGLLAAELGLDVATAKRVGLMHDIGKAVSHEMEGPHATVGAELLRRYGEPPVVVNGVASHHNDVSSDGPYGRLVSAADAISASRPGARSESLATYLKRVEDLEKLAASFPGVERSYAVQAGRELRVFVQPEQVTDEEAFDLARRIASKIQNDLQYPGQIKVTLIRETRCVEVAK